MNWLMKWLCDRRTAPWIYSPDIESITYFDVEYINMGYLEEQTRTWPVTQTISIPHIKPVRYFYMFTSLCYCVSFVHKYMSKKTNPLPSQTLALPCITDIEMGDISQCSLLHKPFAKAWEAFDWWCSFSKLCLGHFSCIQPTSFGLYVFNLTSRRVKVWLEDGWELLYLCWQVERGKLSGRGGVVVGVVVVEEGAE